MFVAASTSCLPDEPLTDIFERFTGLEYTSVELVIGDNAAIPISRLDSMFDGIVRLCRMSRSIAPSAVLFDREPDSPDFFDVFPRACELAHACKATVMTVHAALPGTPFNVELDRLKELVRIGMSYGILIGLATEAGRMADHPDTVSSFCNHVKGLRVTLDPSHYIYNLQKPRDYEPILPFVSHVRLRDTTERQFQTRVGQGVVEFGKLVIQLGKIEYRGALCADLAALPDVDKLGELRKIRLLLESLLW